MVLSRRLEVCAVCINLLIISLWYCVATRGVDGDVFTSSIDDPERTYKKIFNLKDDTEYEISIWALTAAGRGQPKVIVEVTVPSSGVQRTNVYCMLLQFCRRILRTPE